MRDFVMWFLIAGVVLLAGFFACLLLAAAGAWAGEDHPYEKYNQPVAAICALPDQEVEPQLIAVDLEPGERAETACPPGSISVGMQLDIEIVEGAPPLVPGEIRKDQERK